MNLPCCILFLHLIIVCKSDNHAKNEITKPEEKFDFLRKDPGNELGIFATVIAQVHRTANQTTEEWRLNRAYLPNDVYESLMSRCTSDPEDSPFKWRDCVSDDEGLFAHVTWGVPEPKNKTVTYLQLEFKPFSTYNERGNEEICILEEVYKTKAYIVLKTFSALPSNDSFPKGVIESSTTVHQHQLDSFGENFLSIFEDKIEVDKIYNFGINEHYDRDPPYECFLSIASSESKSVIEKKCDFFCPGVSNISQNDLEKILIQAKKVADQQDRKKESLTDKNREEL